MITKSKTVTALKCLKTVLTAYPNLSILVVVPTSTLKDQWKSQLDSWGLGLNAEVEIINTVVKRNNYKADILVLDEKDLSSINLSNCWNPLRVF